MAANSSSGMVELASLTANPMNAAYTESASHGENSIVNQNLQSTTDLAPRFLTADARNSAHPTRATLELLAEHSDPDTAIANPAASGGSETRNISSTAEFRTQSSASSKEPSGLNISWKWFRKTSRTWLSKFQCSWGPRHHKSGETGAHSSTGLR